MRVLQMIAIVALLCAATGTALGQDTLYVEEFTDSTLALNWFNPWPITIYDLEIANMPGNPSGDGWVGRVWGDTSTANLATTVAGELSMADYEVQAWVYCTLSPGFMVGPYQAIAARWDTTGETSRYYYFAADFGSNERLRFRKYISGTASVIWDWSAAQIPGGMPTVDGWHHMALKCEGNQFWCYWDFQVLPDCPLTDSEIANGFFGVYAWEMDFMTGLGDPEMYFDDFLVLGEATGVPTSPVKTALQPVSLSITEAYPNPFNPAVTLRYENVQPGTLTLTVFDVAGRPVGVLADGFHPAGVWNVTWESHQLGAGVYYAVLEGNGKRSTYPLTLVK